MATSFKSIGELAVPRLGAELSEPGEGQAQRPRPRSLRTSPRVPAVVSEKAKKYLASKIEAHVMNQRRELDARLLQDELPFWDDENRGVPNPLIRSGLFSVRATTEREYLEKLEIASLANYSIQYTGKELQQDDLSVWMSLINLARDQPISDSVFFTAYALVKDLSWTMNQKSYKRAQESIQRLKVNEITINTKKDGVETSYSGSLIREYAWAHNEGTGSSRTRWMVRFEPQVSKLFMEDTTTLLEWDTRKKIGPRATVAQWLHTFYSSHAEPYPMTVGKIHELSRSSDTLSSFRKTLLAALQRLKEVDFLEDFQMTKTMVTVARRKVPRLIINNT